uniref:Nucleolar protein 16 n=1 Tax=Chenopodium quinoa TaxID=63459 RepID=A0A803L9W1_CHEQI
MGGSRRKYKKSRIHKVKVGLPKKNPKIVKPAFNLPPKLRALIDPLGTKWDEQGSVISNYKQFGVVSNPNLLSVRSRTSHMIESDSLQVPPPRPDNPADAKVDEFEPVDSGSDLEEDVLVVGGPGGEGVCGVEIWILRMLLVSMREVFGWGYSNVSNASCEHEGGLWLGYSNVSNASCEHEGGLWLGYSNVSNASCEHEGDLKSALGKKRRDGKKVPSQPLTTMQRAHLLPLIEKYGDDYERMFRDTKLNSMQHSVATLKNLCQRYYQWKDTNPLITGKLA